MTTIRRIGLGMALFLATVAPALPGSRLMFPRVPSADDRFTGIAVLNAGTDTAVVTATAYLSDGRLVAGPGITNPVTLTIEAGRQYAKLAREIFGGAGSADFEWIEVRSTTDGLTGFFLEGSSDGRAMDGSDLAATGTDLILPLVDATTEISVVNPEATRAAVEIDLVRADGTLAATRITGIEAHGALHTEARTLLDGANDVASLRMRSNQPLACFGFYSRTGGDSFAIMAAQDATVPSRTLYLPQFLNGEGWTTTVGIRNLAPSPTLVTVTAFDADGRLLIPPALKTNPVTRLLAGSGTLRANLEALFGLSGESLQVGWLRVDAAENALLGYVDFVFGGERMLETARLVGGNRLAFSHQVTTLPYFTSLALLNSSERTANVEVASLDPNGKVRGHFQGILKAGQQLTSTIDRLIPEASGTSGGSIFIKSDVPLMASEIFGTDTLSALSNISPQALPASFDPTAGLPRVRVTPPLAVVETGKSLRFSASGGPAIDWLLNGVKGGTQENGSLTAAGLYTAPKSAPPARTLTVQAVAGTLSAGAAVDVVQRESLVGGLSIVTAVAYAESLGRFYIAEQQVLAQEGKGAEGRNAVSGLSTVLEQTPGGDLKPVVALSLDTIAKIVPFVSAAKTYLLLAGLDRGVIYRFDLETATLATVATGLSRPSSMALDTFSGDLVVAESGTGRIVLLKRKSFDPSFDVAEAPAAEHVDAGDDAVLQLLESAGVQGVAFDSCTGAIYATGSDGTLREYLGSRVRTVTSGLNRPGPLLVLHRTGVSPCAQGVSLLVTESDRLIQVFPQAGEVLEFSGDLQDPADLAYMNSGNPYLGGGSGGVLLGDRPVGSKPGRVLALVTGDLYESDSGDWSESDIVNPQQSGALPFTDPRGDTFETGATNVAGLQAIDCLSIAGHRIGDDFVLSLSFSAPVQPLSAAAPNSLSGRIDVDTGAGGIESSAAAFNPFRQPVGVGVTATIDLGTAEMTLVGPPSRVIPVEMHFVDNIVTVAIPVSLVDFSTAKLVAIVGNSAEATDVIPNERRIGLEDEPNDEPVVSFAIGRATVSEPDGAVEVQVMLSKPSQSVVTVDYRVTGGTAAGNGVDYSLTGETLVFQPGQTVRSFTLSVNDDTVHELAENVVIGLFGPSHAALAAASSFTCTILDDDPTPGVQFSAATSSGLTIPYTVPVAVTLSAPSSEVVSVVCSVTGGTAKEGTDFRLSGSNVVFGPGQLTRTVNLEVLECADCRTARPELTVQLSLSEAIGAILGERRVHTHSIPPTEQSAGVPAVQFQQASSAGLESVANVTIPVTLSAASSAVVTVDYAVSGGSALGGGTDYVLVPGTLTYQPGVTSQEITLAVVNDSLPEPAETIVVSLSSPQSAGLGTNASHTYTITDDDSQYAITLEPSPLTLKQGRQAAVTLTLGTPAGPDGVTVSLAALGPQRVYVPGTVTVSPGQKTVAFGVTAGVEPGTADLVATAPGYSTGKLSIVITPDDGQTNGKTAATMTLGNLSQTYDGTPRSVNVTTNPAGLTGITVTYNGSTTAPTNAGSYTVVASLSNADYEAPDVSGTLTVAKASATVTLSSLSHLYDGTPKNAIATTNPPGLSGVTVTYDGSGAAPTSVGTYAVVARLDNSNYAASNVSGLLTIATEKATLILGNLSQAYDGTPKSVTVTTEPPGLSGVTVTYNGSPAPPTNAGSYTIVAALANPSYAAPDATGTLTITKATATLALGGLSQSYDGTPKKATVTTDPEGLSGVTVTYDGSATAPTGAGNYTVTASLNNANYSAPSVSGTMAIAKASAALTLGNLIQTYDGTPKSVAVTTTPGGLSGVAVTYEGSPTAPTNAGSYAVVASLANANYTASDARATLTISKVSATLTLVNLSQIYDGTPKNVTVTTNPVGLTGVAVSYSGSLTPPTNAGSYAVVATLNNPNATAPDAVGTLTVAKANATLSLGNLSQLYDGTPKSVTVTTTPAGLSGVTVTYDGSPTAPANIGSYTVLAGLTNANYSAPDVSGTLTITSTAAKLTLGNLSQIYDGTPKSVTVTTSPAGLSGVTVTYNGSTTPPTDAGSYAVVATLTNPDYSAPDATGTLTIAKAAATLILGNLSQTWDGTPKSVTVATDPAGLSGVTVTYNGSATAPVNVGNYAVVATLSNSNFTAPDATGTLTVAKAAATLTLGGLSQTYNGSAKSVTVSTVPSGLAVEVTYGGSTSQPVNAGSYSVAARVVDPNYQASASATLVILPASQTITFGPLPDLVYAAQTFAVSATASSGLPVSFSAAGSCSILTSSAVLADAKTRAVALPQGSGTVAVTGAGTCSVTASQPGDGNYLPAAPVTQSFTIAKAGTTTSITSHSPNPSTTTQVVTVTFSVGTSTPGIGPPTGTVTVSDGTASCSATVAAGQCSLTLTTPGTRSLTATYSGDANFNGSSGTASHTVSTLIGLLSTPRPAGGAADNPTSLGGTQMNRPSGLQVGDGQVAAAMRLGQVEPGRAV